MPTKVLPSASFAALLTCLAACGSSSSTPGIGGESRPGSTAPTTAMGAPSELTAEPMGTGIHLTWKINSTAEQQFEIERKEAAGTFAKAASVPFSTASYHDVGVAEGKTYAYRVRAVSGATASPYSNEGAATAPTSNGGPAVTAPDAGPINVDVANPTFAVDIAPLLAKSCGSTSSGCHNRDQYAATSSRACRGWLSTEDTPLGSRFYGGSMNGQPTNCPDRTLYQRLTQLDAWQEPSGSTRRYVRAEDPNNSYLYNKIAGGPYAEKAPGVPSDPMPTAASLPTAEIQLVKRWIEQGAKP